MIENFIPSGVQLFPVGTWIPEFCIRCVDGQICKDELIGENRDWRLDAKVLEDENFLFDNKIKRSVPNLWRDDGQNFLALIDQIAGMIEDVQNARVMRICQPITGGGGKRKSINGLHYVLSRFCQ